MSSPGLASPFCLLPPTHTHIHASEKTLCLPLHFQGTQLGEVVRDPGKPFPPLLQRGSLHACFVWCEYVEFKVHGALLYIPLTFDLLTHD